MTPLQMLIAEKIIDKKGLKDNVLFVVAYSDNDKFRYYYDRLSQKCVQSYFFKINENNLFTRLFSMLRLKKIVSSLSIQKFNSCYLASIDCSYIQLITSNTKFENIYTFDDGTINIIKTSSYYSDKKISFLESVLRFILNVKHTVSFYRKNSCLHYSIFDNENIIQKIEKIELVSNDLISNSDKNSLNVVKFFIGQPLSEIHIPKQKLVDFLNCENINYYFPHPREKLELDCVNYIATDKIFEEYIADYLSDNPTKLVYLYTFFSSVALSVKSIPRVKVISCYSNLINKKYRDAYYIFKSFFIKNPISFTYLFQICSVECF